MIQAPPGLAKAKNSLMKQIPMLQFDSLVPARGASSLVGRIFLPGQGGRHIKVRGALSARSFLMTASLLICLGEVGEASPGHQAKQALGSPSHPEDHSAPLSGQQHYADPPIPVSLNQRAVSAKLLGSGGTIAGGGSAGIPLNRPGAGSGRPMALPSVSRHTPPGLVTVPGSFSPGPKPRPYPPGEGPGSQWLTIK